MTSTSPIDDDLRRFEDVGTPPLPPADEERFVEHDGARLWCASFGRGEPVLLLHGGLGHGGNWSHQVPAVVASGRRAILIDTRGHGRSTRDDRPFSYERLARDALAVMDTLHVRSAAIVGWSDGACTGLVLASLAPERVAGVLFFACNMDPSGAKPFTPTPLIDRCLARHRADYARLSPTPDGFESLMSDLTRMQATQPNYSADQLAAIRVPVTVVHAEGDEFIRPEHAEYLARTIPGAQHVPLKGVTHFAPLQRPTLFNETVLAFLEDRR